MKVTLYDWQHKGVEFDIGDIEDTARITFAEISGDEVLTVVKKDSTIKRYDSSNDRRINHIDAEFDIYNINNGTDNIDDWLDRNE